MPLCGAGGVAVVAPGDNVNMVASDDATTCHIVILRDVHSGVTGLAHLDNEEPNDFLTLEREVKSITTSSITLSITSSISNTYM